MLDTEKTIKRAFCGKFKRRREHGTEYFEGDIDDMLCIFQEICCESKTSKIANQLAEFGSVEEGEKLIKVVKKEIPCLLSEALNKKPKKEQIANRIKKIFKTIYRNPEYPELKNIIINKHKNKEHAFVFVNGRWKPEQANALKTYILSYLSSIIDSVLVGCLDQDKLEILGYFKHCAVARNLPQPVNDILINIMEG